MTNSNPPNDPPIFGRDVEDPTFWTFREVEGRLIEALRHWRRMPDRERGWLHVKALWPELKHHGWRVDVEGEFSEREMDPVPRRPHLTRGQIAQMNEASEWLLIVPERDRRMVALALAFQVAGGDRRMSWERVWRDVGRGRPGPDGLRMRYSRAITRIAQHLTKDQIPLSC
ncbi:MAG TPA: hypothetical protein VMS43_13990 [Allosphingosinicella sp.]|nr:hypothetical protein [Allosphingosinicella sp.]